MFIFFAATRSICKRACETRIKHCVHWPQETLSEWCGKLGKGNGNYHLNEENELDW